VNSPSRRARTPRVGTCTDCGLVGRSPWRASRPAGPAGGDHVPLSSRASRATPSRGGCRCSCACGESGEPGVSSPGWRPATRVRPPNACVFRHAGWRTLCSLPSPSATPQRRTAFQERGVLPSRATSVGAMTGKGNSDGQRTASRAGRLLPDWRPARRGDGRAGVRVPPVRTSRQTVGGGAERVVSRDA
jgi:hypothetical protein